MSSLINRLLGNLATRMMLLIYISIILITSFFIIFSYYNALTLQEQRQYDKLTAIVSAMAVNIDGDSHQELMKLYQSQAGLEEIESNEVYRRLSDRMHKIVEENDLSPMYTLVYDEKQNTFIYGVRSDDFVDFGNTYIKSPDELREHMDVGGVIPMYMTENGKWLSAFYPIKDKGGNVVALLEADIEFSKFQELVNERYLKETLISLSVIILLTLFLIPYARKILLRDALQKRLALNQRKLIETKNRDIMDSIQYAKKIQKAMLPSLRSFEDNNLEGFVFYKAKSVVAGDFYWMERYGDDLFFAVADCTGHGVPGAIISILCSNALNRATEVLGLRDPAIILDSVREMIISRIGVGDETMQDGMDIALCKLNLKTFELTYSGANNPIYIYKVDSHDMIIAPAAKQPVGSYVVQKPFESQHYQLNEGDLIYLFTDGFADQFGGEKGKKFKYKPFKELLLKNTNLPMERQKKELQHVLREWTGEYDQVDDICVMGVKL